MLENELPGIGYKNVSDKASLLAALDRQEFHFVISNIEVNDINGLDALNIIKSTINHPPFVFLAEKFSTEFVIKAHRNGADDTVFLNSLGDLISSIKIGSNSKSLVELNNELSNYLEYFNRSSDLLCIANTSGYFEQINPAFIKVLGFSKEELLSKPFLDLIHPDDIESTLKEMNKLSDGIPTAEFQNRYRTGKGDYKWISWTASAQKETGKIFANAKDVTDSEFLKQVYTSISFDTGKIYFETLCNFLVTELDISGAMILSVPVGKDEEYEIPVKTIKTKKNHIKESESILYEIVDQAKRNGTKLFDKNGIKNTQGDDILKSLGFESYYCKLLFDSKQNNIGLIIIVNDKEILDISLKKKLVDLVSSRTSHELQREIAEYKSGQNIDQLEKIAAQYKSLTENVSNVVIQVDRNSKIIRMSGDTATIDHTKTINRSLYEFINPMYHDLIENKIFMVFNDSKGSTYETHEETPAGLTYLYRSNIGPVYNADGQVDSAVIVIQDITEFVNLQSITYKISQATSRRNVSVKSICKMIHDEIKNIISVENIFIALKNEQNKAISFPYFVDQTNTKLTHRNQKEKLLNKLTKRVLSMSKTEHIDDFDEYLKKIKFEYQGSKPKTWIGIPIKAEGKTIGVFAIWDYNFPNRFSNSEINFIEHLSIQLGLVIEKQHIINQLHKSEHHFRSLVEHSSDISILLDKKRVINYVSPSVLKILGYEPYELIGKYFPEILHPSNRLYSSTALEQVVTNNNYIVRFEFKLQHKDGKWVDMEATCSSKEDIENKFDIVINAHDITTRKNFENRIQNNNIRLRFMHRLFERVLNNLDIESTIQFALKGILRNLINSHNVSVTLISQEETQCWVMDKSSFEINRVKNTNDTLCGFIRKLQQQNLGSNIYLKNLIDTKEKGRHIKQLIKNGLKSYYVHPLIHGNKLIGSLNIGSKEANFMTNIEAEVMEEYADSISLAAKHHSLHETLKHNENNLSNLLNTMNEAVIQIDKDGFIQYINKVAHKYFDTQNEELIKQDIRMLFPYDTTIFNNSLEYLIDLSEKDENYRRIRINSAKSKSKWGQLNISILKDGSEITGLLIVINDITDSFEKENIRRKMIIEGEENERQRLAHDLHDGLGQTIAAASMYVGSLEHQIESSVGEATLNNYQKAKELIQKAVIETRTISHNIMPRSLQEFGLTQTLEELSKNISDINESISIDISQNIYNRRFEDDIELSLYRVIQEIINNTIRHSKASKLNLELIYKPGNISLNACDNGIGMLLEKTNSGLGIESMRNRINAINGQFEIKSTPQIGTNININIPAK